MFRGLREKEIAQFSSQLLNEASNSEGTWSYQFINGNTQFLLTFRQSDTQQLMDTLIDFMLVSDSQKARFKIAQYLCILKSMGLKNLTEIIKEKKDKIDEIVANEGDKELGKQIITLMKTFMTVKIIPSSQTNRMRCRSVPPPQVEHNLMKRIQC